MPDVYYVYIAIIILAVVSLIVSASVNISYKKYSNVFLSSGMTAEQIVKRITESNGTRVDIGRVSGHLTDHYNPTDDTVYLSDTTYGSSSVSAIGVAAHEAGHAVQESEGYLFMKIRSFLVPVVNFSCRWSLLIIIAGFLIDMFVLDSPIGRVILTIGLVMYAMATLFTLITLPVEFNASRRAVDALREYMDEDELKGVKAVLRCAALTYVVAFASSLLQLLRIIMIFNRRRD